MLAEDASDGGARHSDTQADEFAVDAPISPDRVVARHFQHQIADSSLDSRASRTAVRVAPVALDDVGVPAQQRAWRDDQAQMAALLAGDQPVGCQKSATACDLRIQMLCGRRA